MSDIIIIGGGVSGTAAAWELSRQGRSVTILEQGELHSMGSGWTLAGVRQSGRHPSELPLAKAAVKRWETLNDELDADVEYRQGGNLRLAITPQDDPIIRNVVGNGNASGIVMHYLMPDDVAHIAPMVRKDIVGASLCPTDGHANNHKAVQAWAAAAQRMGATIRTNITVNAILTKGNRVTGVSTSEGDLGADVVIVAAGIYTPTLLAPLGFNMPINIVIDSVAQTVPVEPMLTQVLGVADGSFAGRQEANGSIRFIGTSVDWPGTDHRTYSTDPTTAQMRQMMTTGIDMLPTLADIPIQRVWGGLIDKTPDALPVLDGATGIDGLVVGAGFSGHGFGIAPATGEILADLAVGEPTQFDLKAFRLARFDEGVHEADGQLHG